MSKKEIVIEKARELFTKYGYKKVAMDEIAKAANVTKKTIYTYFEDKESMFRYFINEELETMKENIELIYKEKLSFFNKVAKSLYYMLSYRKNSSLLKAINYEKENEISSKFLQDYDKEIINYIKEKIDKEIKSNNIKKCNSKLMAFIIYKIYLALLFEYEDELNEKEVTKEVTLILKDGLFN